MAEVVIEVNAVVATLISLGAVEMATRGEIFDHRGPVLIRARYLKPEMEQTIGEFDVLPADPPGQIHPNHREERPARIYPAGGASWWALRSDEIVASAVVTDCVPILEVDTGFRHSIVVEDGLPYRVNHDTQDLWPMSAHLPYGDFRPGRWALLFDDVVRLEGST